MEPTETSVKNSYGSVLSILLIVAILVVGAWYVWHKRIVEERERQTPLEEPTQTAPAVQASTSVSL